MSSASRRGTCSQRVTPLDVAAGGPDARRLTHGPAALFNVLQANVNTQGRVPALGSAKYLYVEGEWTLIWPQSAVQVETHTLASDGSFYC